MRGVRMALCRTMVSTPRSIRLLLMTITWTSRKVISVLSVQGVRGPPSPDEPITTATDVDQGVAITQNVPVPAITNLPTFPTSDYPLPPALLKEAEVLVWDEDALLPETYAKFGKRLAATGDIYRNPNYASGLPRIQGISPVPPTPITDPRKFGAVPRRPRTGEGSQGRQIKGKSYPQQPYSLPCCLARFFSSSSSRLTP